MKLHKTIKVKIGKNNIIFGNYEVQKLPEFIGTIL